MFLVRLLWVFFRDLQCVHVYAWEPKANGPMLGVFLYCSVVLSKVCLWMCSHFPGSSCLHLSTLVLQLRTPPPPFYMGARDPSSGLQACTLPIDLSPHSQVHLITPLCISGRAFISICNYPVPDGFVNWWIIQEAVGTWFLN